MHIVIWLLAYAMGGGMEAHTPKTLDAARIDDLVIASFGFSPR